MKKLIFILLTVSILLSALMTGCKKETEEITKIEYVVPEWKGSLDEEPSNPHAGWAYYNTKVRQSFIFDGNSWQIMAQDGKDGENGTGIVWKGELSNEPSTPQYNWAYYNTVDGNSYIFNGSTWDYLAKSGKNGTSGILLWIGMSEQAPVNPSEGWAYYNTLDKCSYIYSNGSWQILAKDGVSIVWKGTLAVAPSSPKPYWAYHNLTDQTSYIWNGNSWDILSTSLGGNTTVTVPIKWLGTFKSAPTSLEIGNAYYNSTVGASYIYDGSVWQQISKDGIDGQNGTNGSAAGYLIEWKGSSKTVLSNPSAGWAYYNSQEKKSFIFDGTQWQIMAQDGADGNNGGSSNSGTSDGNGLTYMGETTETIDGVTYTVKSYAEVHGNPYFYDYYKYYYLNNKIRRSSFSPHSSGCDLDYKYTEFVEHICRSNSRWYYTYYENGKLESSTLESSGMVNRAEYFENGNKKLQQTIYNGVINSLITYFDNSNNAEKSILNYNTNNGSLNSEKYQYSNGKVQLYVVYNSDRSIDRMEYYYTSGYMQYYYTDNGYLYTYDDGKTMNSSTSSNYYSSKDEYTEQKAIAKLNELRPN